MKLLKQLASSFIAFHNCRKTGNTEWLDRHEERINKLVREHLPSGGGFDSGTKFDWDKSSEERLVFSTSFHHMNEVGYYDGWTEHEVIVTPSLAFDFKLRITGRDRNDIKELIAETFHTAFTNEVTL